MDPTVHQPQLHSLSPPTTPMDASKRKTGFLRQEWATLGTLLLGVFMGSLDITIVGPAFSSVVESFASDFRAVAWTLSLYILVYVVANPIMATLSDRLGRRRIYMLCIGLFAVGSLAASLSPNLPSLLAGRAIQAMGAGGILPVASAVATETIAKERRGMALGLVGMMWGASAIVGPSLGGILTEHLGWRSVFWLNIPMCALVALLARKHLPQRASRARGPLDIWGLVLMAIGLTSLTAGLNQVGHGKTDVLATIVLPRVYVPMIIGLAVLALFARHETRTEWPVMRPEYLFRRNLGLANLLSLAAGTVEACMAFSPAFAMASLGYSKQAAGSLVSVAAIAMFVGAPAGGGFLDRYGAKKVLMVSTVLTALGNILFGLSDSTAWFVGSLCLMGLGLSALVGAPLRFIAANETTEQERATAQGVLSVFTSMGISMGAAIVGALVASGSADGTSLVGYRRAYFAVGAIAVVGFFLAMMLKPQPSQAG